VLINAARSFGQLGLGDFAATHDSYRLPAVPASSLAMARLGRPIPGAPLLAALAALAGVVSLDAVLAAIT
jgi:pyruvate ferredoxin oxidoreductase gamma subunit